MKGTKYYCKSDEIIYEYVESITVKDKKRSEGFYIFKYFSEARQEEKKFRLLIEQFNYLIKQKIWEKK